GCARRGAEAVLALPWASADRYRCFRSRAVLSTLRHACCDLFKLDLGSKKHRRALLGHGFAPALRAGTDRADECTGETRPEREMYVVDTDPTGRTAGQYARAAVERLRLRTLGTLSVLAVA